MFIKRTMTKRVGNRRYFTHRLIWSEREGRALRYTLNLGANYPVPKEQWRDLCDILERLTDEGGQQLLFDFEDAGDAWTWTALDSDSKLIVSYLTGPRDGQSALEFMDDLSKRITERPQLSTDGLKAYREAVDDAFGGDVDFAQIIKEYGKDKDADERKYSPAKCTGMEIVVVQGSPDLDLSMRMGMRRFTGSPG